MRAFLFPLATLVCFAQDSAAKPQIAFAKTHHDFGKLPGDKKVTYRFKVSNQGKAYLNITQLNPSCGCTSTNVGKWSLAPGENTEIEVAFDPSKFSGPVRKSLQVVSDDPVSPISTLTFEAEVVHEITLNPTALFFVDMPRSTTRKSSVRLVSGNGQPVQVTAAKAPGAPYLSATWRAEGKDAVVEVTVDGKKLPAGVNHGTDNLTIQTTNARFSAIPVTVQWDVKRAVTATPERVSWVKPATATFSDTLTLSSVAGRPFRITGVRTSTADVVVSNMPSPSTAAASHKVTIGFARPRTGYFNEWAIFTLDDPDQSELHVRVSAAIQ